VSIASAACDPDVQWRATAPCDESERVEAILQARVDLNDTLDSAGFDGVTCRDISPDATNHVVIAIEYANNTGASVRSPIDNALNRPFELLGSFCDGQLEMWARAGELPLGFLDQVFADFQHAATGCSES